MKVPCRVGAVVASLVVGVLSLSAPLAAAASTTPRSGGNLTILDESMSWASTDPIQPVGTTSGFVAQEMAYQNLFQFSSTGQLEPLLATNWSYNAAHTVLTITLRKGVTFQDGTPFNAAAVVYDFERVAPASSGSECVPFFTTISSFAAPSPYKVVITTLSPYSALLDILGGEPCSQIESPTALQTLGATAFAEHPVGTSPWAWQSSIIDQSIDYVHYKHSWQKTYLNSITIQSIGSDQSAEDAVETDTAQMYGGSFNSVSDIPAVHGIKSVYVTLSPENSTNFLRLNLGSAPFNNLLAREAVAHALNLSLLAKAVYGKEATPTESMLSPESWGFDGNRVRGYPQYNPSLAASEVAQLPGGKLNFAIVLESIPGQINYTEAMAGELEAVPGITVTLDEVSVAQELSLLHGKTFQAFLAAGPALPDPDFTYWRNFDCTSNNNDDNFCSQAYDGFVEEARATFSQPQRKVLYEKAQEILAQQLPILPLFNGPVFWISNKKVHNPPLLGTATIDFSQTWLSR